MGPSGRAIGLVRSAMPLFIKADMLKKVPEKLKD